LLLFWPPSLIDSCFFIFSLLCYRSHHAIAVAITVVASSPMQLLLLLLSPPCCSLHFSIVHSTAVIAHCYHCHCSWPPVDCCLFYLNFLVAIVVTISNAAAIACCCSLLAVPQHFQCQCSCHLPLLLLLLAAGRLLSRVDLAAAVIACIPMLLSPASLLAVPQSCSCRCCCCSKAITTGKKVCSCCVVDSRSA